MRLPVIRDWDSILAPGRFLSIHSYSAPTPAACSSIPEITIAEACVVPSPPEYRAGPSDDPGAGVVWHAAATRTRSARTKDRMNPPVPRMSQAAAASNQLDDTVAPDVHGNTRQVVAELVSATVVRTGGRLRDPRAV